MNNLVLWSTNFLLNSLQLYFIFSIRRSIQDLSQKIDYDENKNNVESERSPDVDLNVRLDQLQRMKFSPMSTNRAIISRNK